MLDLQDRFIMWLMNEFHESLMDALDNYGKRLSKALTDGKQREIDTNMRMITDTRGIIADMSDENFDSKVFVHLIAQKYGLMKE